jgi:hypothetical protein
MNHFIVVRQDASGQFAAYPAGLPELTVTAASRADAVLTAAAKMNEWLVAGNLVLVRLPGHRNVPATAAEADEESAAYMQRMYEEALERSRREDLDHTLAEYDTEWPSISSTPTT